MDQPALTRPSGKAILSCVLGLLSFCLTFVAGIPAIVLGAMALWDIRNSQGAKTGSDLAHTGIVTGVIGTVIMPILILIAVDAARNVTAESARRHPSSNNMKEIAIGMHVYCYAWERFPPQAIYDDDGIPLLSWRVRLLPYLDEEELYKEFHLNEPWDSEHNKQLIPRMPRVYYNPDVASKSATSYLVPVGEGTIFSGKEGTRLSDITDGTSYTILLVEADADRAVTWTKPDDLIFNPMDPLAGLGSLRATGYFLVAFANGRVQGLEKNLDPETLKAMFTVSGGEPIPPLD